MMKSLSATARKVIYALIAVFALYCVTGFFVVPSVTKSQLQEQVHERFGVTPKIDNIKFNPFSFVMVIEGFDMPAAPGTPEMKSRLHFERLSVNAEIFPFFKKELNIKSLTLKELGGQFVVLQDGRINWQMKPIADEANKVEEKKDKPWILTIDELHIDNSGFEIRDYTHLAPLYLPIGPMTLRAADITTSVGGDSDLNSIILSIGNEGHMKISGSMKVRPLTVKLNLDFLGVPLDFVTAYLYDKTYLRLTDGSIDVLGTMQYQNGNMQFSGDSKIHNLSIDQDDLEDPVLAWSELEAKGIDFNLKPLKMQIQDVTVQEPATEIILRKNGILNIKEFMRSSQAESVQGTAGNGKTSSQEIAPPVSERRTFDYAINRLEVVDGSLDYSDQQIRPNFSAHVHDMNGVIGPITADVNEKTNIDLKGMVEAYGKFAGTGYYLSGADKSTLNVNMNFHNIEMTTFTPYSGKFAGYEISKGKLFLDINYQLVGKRIVGKNKVLLDQFTLGNKVPSEKSTNWPVKFALALMKDRKGQIDFKLPVEGNIDSPAFSWGNLIWTAIKNLVVKVATAPFDYIASLVDGGPDLQNILFTPGTNKLKDGQDGKIGKIAEAMDDRPQLKLEISGRYQEQDVEALKEKKVEKEIQTTMKRTNEPRDVVARKLVSNIKISDDDLKALALERGKVVMASLNKMKVPAERVYLLAGSKGDDGKEPQVLLTVKSE